MDAGALGAVLGFSIMAGSLLCGIFYNNRKRIQKFFFRKRREPVWVPAEIVPLKTLHAKMNHILPPLKTKLVFAKNLKGQRYIVKF